MTDLKHPKSSDGFVCIEEIEASLHYSLTTILLRRLTARFRRPAPRYKVSFFVASGKAIDEKITKINKRVNN